MTLRFALEDADFIAFNIWHNTNITHAMQRSIRQSRLLAAVAVGVILLSYAFFMKTPTPVLLFACAASVVYWLAIPTLLRTSYVKTLKKNMALSKSANEGKVVETQFGEDEMIAVDVDSESRASYRAVIRIAEDDARYFIYIADMQAIIVPFRVFESDAARQTFYAFLTARIAAAKCLAAQ